MSQRINISSGAKWEDVYGYSRAVRVGNIIEVSGTAATEGNEIVSPGNVYEQTKFILKKIEKALKEAGAEMRHVVRTRTFITDITKWEEVSRAHNEVFVNIKPAATLVEVSALIDPQLLVEIEATAIVPEQTK